MARKSDKPPPAETRNNIPGIIPNERAAKVKQLLVCGLDRATIIEFARSNSWKEEPGDIDHYIQVAVEEFANDAGEIDAAEELGKAHARLNYLYMQTIKVQDFKTALSIQKEINKVLALKVTADKLRHPASNTPAGNAGAERPRLSVVK